MDRTGRHSVCALLAGLLLLWNGSALALDTALDVNQYAHTAWRTREGFARSPIGSIAQTQDGYLWLGTEGGLWRFDGVHAVLQHPLPGDAVLDNRIRSLLAARDGSLWIGTGTGLVRMKDGKLIRFPRFNGVNINGLVEDHDGTIWVTGQLGGRTGLLCGIERSGTHCSGADGNLGSVVFSPLEDRAGNLWVLTRDSLWRWKPGPPQRYASPHLDTLQGIAQDVTGALLVLGNGLQRLRDGKFETIPLPADARLSSVFMDRDRGVWLGTFNKGLLHLHDGRFDTFVPSDGGLASYVGRIFEDREGNIWVTTVAGLDRFRALPAVTYPMPRGLLGPSSGSILADRDGSVWIASPEGLHRWQNGKMIAYRPPPENGSPALGPDDVVAPGAPGRAYGSLLRDGKGRIWFGNVSSLGYFQDGRFTAVPGPTGGFFESIVEDTDGIVWISHRINLVTRRADLFRVSPGGSALPAQLPFQGPGPWRLAADPAHGGLWGGFPDGRVIHWIDGAVVASYGPREGLAKGFVSDVRVTPDGAVWVAQDGGLSRIKDNHIATLGSKSGLPCDRVRASIDGDDAALWIYASCGLVRIPRSDIGAWTAAADQRKPLPSVQTMVLTEGDGMSSSPVSQPTPNLTKAPDGKLWLLAADGATMVDPRHLALNTLPPPVHVEQVIADKKTYDPVSGLRLPPLTRNLTIAYTGLSFVSPEQMHFRYKLEGQDEDWREVVNERLVQYSNLAPGDYRFRVTASNNSGIWNNQGAELRFSVAPAYWQTGWFMSLCLATGLGLLAVIFQWRLRVAAAVAAKEQEIERRQHETEVELVHANRLATMGQLTASLAHEVNQPLGAVLMNAQAAIRWLNDPLANLEEARKNLGRIVRDVGRASGIVKRVRTMAKKTPENREDIAINEALAEVIAMTASEATKYQIIVREYFASDLPIVCADRVEVQQVVLNLVMNAIEALSTFNGERKEIVIQTALNASGETEVAVRDFGPGIPPDAQARIFQPFYTSKETGLGMGLSICRTIIEAHGGRLWAEANSPQGAAFIFTLPVKGENPDVY